MKDCKATSDGLGIAKVGDEKKLQDLSEWTWDKVHAFPVRQRARRVNGTSAN